VSGQQQVLGHGMRNLDRARSLLFRFTRQQRWVDIDHSPLARIVI